MATCQSCGKKGLTVTVYPCQICHKKTCGPCLVTANGSIVCKSCVEAKKKDYFDTVLKGWDYRCPLCTGQLGFKDQTYSFYRNFQMVPDVFMIKNKQYYGPIWFNASMTCIKCNATLNEKDIEKAGQAVRAERAGRYEDAAKLYEELNCLDKARSLREKDKTSTVRQYQVNVNLNHLLEQVRQGNLVIPYKCPNCGGSVKISGESSTEKLSKCQYCGSVLATSDIEKFLSAFL